MSEFDIQVMMHIIKWAKKCSFLFSFPEEIVENNILKYLIEFSYKTIWA